MICIFNSGNTVGNDDGGFAFHDTAQVMEYFFLSFGIYCRKTVIENEDLRIFYQCPCDGNPLFLASG